MSHLQIVTHSMVQDSLTHLRDKETSLQKFRHHSDRICEFLFYEAVHDLKLHEVTVETPLTTTTGKKLSEEVIVVPVLRAGLAMLPAALKFLPKSKIGFVGLERDEKTALAHPYYWKLPKFSAKSMVIITDPMLATGGTISHVIRNVRKNYSGKILIVSVIAAPEGVREIQEHFPDVDIYTSMLDERLNDRKYIVPGLGDYGDRYFGTE
jgi:uracil phosphoribosyltransferase